MGIELISDVNWDKVWVQSQMTGIEDVLKEMGGRLRYQSLSQWYFQVCERTFHN